MHGARWSQEEDDADNRRSRGRQPSPSGHFECLSRLCTFRASFGAKVGSSSNRRAFCGSVVARPAPVEHSAIQSTRAAPGEHSAIPGPTRAAPVEHSAASGQARATLFEHAPRQGRFQLSCGAACGWRRARSNSSELRLRPGSSRHVQQMGAFRAKAPTPERPEDPETRRKL